MERIQKKEDSKRMKDLRREAQLKGVSVGLDGLFGGSSGGVLVDGKRRGLRNGRRVKLCSQRSA